MKGKEKKAYIKNCVLLECVHLDEDNTTDESINSIHMVRFFLSLFRHQNRKNIKSLVVYCATHLKR